MILRLYDSRSRKKYKVSFTACLCLPPVLVFAVKIMREAL